MGDGRTGVREEAEEADKTSGARVYTVTGAHVEWLFADGGGIAPSGATNKPSEDFVFTWSRYRSTMILGRVPRAISPSGTFLRPWQQLSTEPAPHYLSTRCPPPAKALACGGGGGPAVPLSERGAQRTGTPARRRSSFTSPIVK